MPPESPQRLEPCLLDSYPPALSDVVADLASEARRLGARLHPTTAASLAELVRTMNCYYSNLITNRDEVTSTGVETCH